MNKYWLLFVCILFLGCISKKSKNNELYTDQIDSEYYIEFRYYNEDDSNFYFLRALYIPADLKEEDEYWRDLLLSPNVIPMEKLADLPNLENLEIALDGAEIDLSFLESIPHIKHLRIVFELQAKCIESLAPLQYLVDLEELFLIWLDGNDISPVGNMKNLKYLNIQDISKEMNIEPLRKLTNLETLHLTNFNGKFTWDSDIFIHLTNLKNLSIEMNVEIDLASISTLSKLKELGITTNSMIHNISMLNNPELEYFAIFHYPWDRSGAEIIEYKLDMNWLLNLTNLNKLCVDSRYIDDLKPLLQLPHLKVVKIESIKNPDVFMPLLDSKTIESIFINPEYYYHFPKELFEERGIHIWTDDR